MELRVIRIPGNQDAGYQGIRISGRIGEGRF
jgi:hypothetical protein